MKCYECGRDYIKHEGIVELSDKRIGKFNINLELYYKCEGCGSLLFPKESADKIALEEDKICNELIRKLPVEEFIMPTEAANILGMTRQAFHKNKRIKKGFIYSVIIGGKRLYSSKSVGLFKKNNDGRFNLVENAAPPRDSYYMEIIIKSEASELTNYDNNIYPNNIVSYVQ